MVEPANRPPLALTLLLTAEWFDRSVRELLADEGWPRLGTNQSRLVAEVDGRRSQAELARRLGITRQSVHVIVRRLRDLDLVDVVDGAVVLTATGRRMTARARTHLDVLETQLQAELDAGAERGTDPGSDPGSDPATRARPRVDVLRSALADWLARRD